MTDFEGLSHGSFDGRGNYHLGIRDWSAFLEVDSQHANLHGLQHAPGLGVLVHTSTQCDDEAKLLLSALRFPFC